MRLQSVLAALLISLLAGTNSALAQYPDQPVKVVVPFAAGGFMDTVARVATERLARSLG
jgi:tripartite-type tricarboxylate transporter receptor subunit TctC